MSQSLTEKEHGVFLDKVTELVLAINMSKFGSKHYAEIFDNAEVFCSHCTEQ